MAKRLPVLLAFVLLLAFVSSQAFGSTTPMTDVAVKYVAYFFALGIAVFGGTQAQSKAAAVALEGIARNPAAADKIQTPMILGLALMESLVIFALISTFLV